MSVLVVGWPSPLHGEATAGDVLAMDAVGDALAAAGVPHRLAWSEAMLPARTGPADVLYQRARGETWEDVVWVCGPLHGAAPLEVMSSVAANRTWAVGVSVVDAGDPAVRAAGTVLHRDAPGLPTTPDLAFAAPSSPTRPPANPEGLGIVLAAGQREYGARRRHDEVSAAVLEWAGRTGSTTRRLDTRLDPRDPSLPHGPQDVEAALGGVSAIVTTRMHGVVHAVRLRVPVVAVDPVAGGGKVTAQARVLGLDAVPAEHVMRDPRAVLDRALAGAPGAHELAHARTRAVAGARLVLDRLVAGLRGARIGR